MDKVEFGAWLDEQDKQNATDTDRLRNAWNARQPEIDALTEEVALCHGTLDSRTRNIETLMKENSALNAEVERLRADAERYRWLREHVAEIDFWGDEFVLDREQLDEHIDALMKETK